ncbi:MAG: bifunctional 3,4-dihydroxy-2-butanone-4-phosphate synthase/GTP cyclohydrolase II [Candidatus Omnitrophica bacterium]|nr:bifunctional 3,4-dihydroxy-2-butanone-4-phosphate synthase/GTP cyclohydrolase II [Candidatus Omnitrophota bacterium]
MDKEGKGRVVQFNTIEEVISDIKFGKMVIVIDDEDRENEGDLIMSASFVTPEDINFMAKHGRGLICVPMDARRLAELELYPLSYSERDPYKTGWVISVDAKKGITTGISAYDRAHTVRVLSNPNTKAADLVKPGHIFPLKAQEGGVLVRAGHTEACVDLLQLAGLPPIGVICEIMNDDGTMARTPQLIDFANKYNLKICTIASIIEYRRRTEKLVEKIVETFIPTRHGEFKLILYASKIDKEHHVALVKGDISKGDVLVRVHSQCLTGDVLGSLRCDCGEQLNKAMEIIQTEGKGVILYMRQEGRGIGLVNKIKAYALQDKGLDTVEANEALGFKADLRDYGIGAQILVDLKVKNIRLLTNNPHKIVGLSGYGLNIVERIPLEVGSTGTNTKYLKAKKEKLGHYLTI